MYLHKRRNKNSTVYYLCKNGRKKGTSTIVWQKYVGTANRIAKLMEEHKNLAYIKFHTYPYGKTAAFMAISTELDFVDTVNKHTTKKAIDGLTVGEYMLLIVLNRLTKPASKNKLGKWFNGTFLKLAWEFDHKLNEQNFWNHMSKLDEKSIESIELDITKTLLDKGITPKHLILDTTNFFTHMKTGGLLKKGKSKDGKHSKNLLGFGLAVSQHNIPFIHKLYEGSKPDSKIFTAITDRIMAVLKGFDIEELVAIFDKGNNSKDNMGGLKMSFVGSLQRKQAKELLDIPLSSYTKLYKNSREHEIYGYRTRKRVFGEEYTVVVAYNEHTYSNEKRRFDRELSKAKGNLSKLKPRKRRYDAFVKAVEMAIPKGVKSVVRYRITGKRKLAVEWHIDEARKSEMEKGFGKTILFTDLEKWKTADIIKTYNSKNVIEDDFKLLKNRLVIPIPPVYHRKEEMQRVHVFLCVIGLLILRYLLYKCKKFKLSRNELLEELEGIRIGIVKDKGDKKTKVMFEEMSVLQANLMGFLNLGVYMKQI